MLLLDQLALNLPTANTGHDDPASPALTCEQASS